MSELEHRKNDRDDKCANCNLPFHEGCVAVMAGAQTLVPFCCNDCADVWIYMRWMRADYTYES